MLSPSHAPAAAEPSTKARSRRPLAASTPAVITAVSDGTTGKKASSAAMPKSTRYVQLDAVIRSRRDSNTPA
jgi:hypothetical protein